MVTDKTPLISIVMPVYGVEKYVGKAIDSIIAQTLEDWELFAIDDGSPDRSGQICDEYARKDSRIHIIHKENGGAPSARNQAIGLTKGKYLYFMDSDDWAEPDMLSDMYELAEKNDSQLVVTGFYIDTYYTDFDKYTQEQKSEARVYGTQQEFRLDSYRLFDTNLLYTPWNKLYLASYIKENNIFFPETFWDDFPFNLAVIRDIERVCVSEKKYYHFIRKREESETAKYREDMFEKREEEDGWMNELYAYWKLETPEIREFLDRRYVERLIGCVENVTNDNCTLTKTEKRKYIRNMISSTRARKALKNVRPRSKYMKLMIVPLKWKNTWLTYIEGRVISSVKSGNTKLFAKLKANR